MATTMDLCKFMLTLLILLSSLIFAMKRTFPKDQNEKQSRSQQQSNIFSKLIEKTSHHKHTAWAKRQERGTDRPTKKVRFSSVVIDIDKEMRARARMGSAAGAEWPKTSGGSSGGANEFGAGNTRPTGVASTSAASLSKWPSFSRIDENYSNSSPAAADAKPQFTGGKSSQRPSALQNAMRRHTAAVAASKLAVSSATASTKTTTTTIIFGEAAAGNNKKQSRLPRTSMHLQKLKEGRRKGATDPIGLPPSEGLGKLAGSSSIRNPPPSTRPSAATTASMPFAFAAKIEKPLSPFVGLPRPSAVSNPIHKTHQQQSQPVKMSATSDANANPTTALTFPSLSTAAAPSFPRLSSAFPSMQLPASSMLPEPDNITRILSLLQIDGEDGNERSDGSSGGSATKKQRKERQSTNAAALLDGGEHGKLQGQQQHNLAQGGSSSSEGGGTKQQQQPKFEFPSFQFPPLPKKDRRNK